MDSEFLKKIEQILGHHFKDATILIQALTHSSHEGSDYERLEFLGDRIVNFIIADLLYQTFPEESEGDLAKRHTALVQGETLARALKRKNLQEFIRLSESEISMGGRENDNILCDVLEALTAALYLDAGVEVTRHFVKDALGEDLETMDSPPQDPKTELQEWSQSLNLGLPEYKLIEKKGPDHKPEFTVEVTVHGYESLSATGSSKRIAEKLAATGFLERLKAKA